MVSWGRGIDRGWLVSWGWVVWLGLWVLGSSLIGDISDKSIISIGGILDSLDSAIRKSNWVRSLDIAVSIVGFLLVEVGFWVVISHSIGVGVGGGLSKISILMNSWGMVGWGSMIDRGRGMVSTIRPGGSNSEEGSSNESLQGRNNKLTRMNNFLEKANNFGLINNSYFVNDYLPSFLFYRSLTTDAVWWESGLFIVPENDVPLSSLMYKFKTITALTIQLWDTCYR